MSDLKPHPYIKLHAAAGPTTRAYLEAAVDRKLDFMLNTEMHNKDDSIVRLGSQGIQGLGSDLVSWLKGGDCIRSLHPQDTARLQGLLMEKTLDYIEFSEDTAREGNDPGMAGFGARKLSLADALLECDLLDEKRSLTPEEVRDGLAILVAIKA